MKWIWIKNRMHEPNLTPWWYKTFVSIQWSWRDKSNHHLVCSACHSQHNHKRSRISLSTSKALLSIQQLVISTPKYKCLPWSQPYAIFTLWRCLNVKMSLTFKASRKFTTATPTNNIDELKFSHQWRTAVDSAGDGLLVQTCKGVCLWFVPLTYKEKREGKRKMRERNEILITSCTQSIMEKRQICL